MGGEEVFIHARMNRLEQLAGLGVEWHRIVELLLIALGYGEAFAFHGVDMDHHGRVGVLYSFERLDEAGHVVAVGHIEISEAHGFEQIALGGAVGVAQQAQILIDTSVVGGYAHLVVVDHHDEVRPEGGGVVETLEGLASAEGAVADYGYDVLLSAPHVARFGQAGSQSHGRCVAD